MTCATVVGAGLAGLSAATELVAAGHAVTVYEATERPGGRCRSYPDPALDAIVDNGAHIVLSGNRQVAAYLDRLGARDRLEPMAEAGFPFRDLATGDSWVLRPNRGRLGWWILDADRRTPGTSAADMLASAWALLRAPADATVADALGGRRVAFERLWRPLTIAALNCVPEEASAHLLRHVLWLSFRGNLDTCQPMLARRSLADTFVDPALAWLAARGVAVATGARLRRLVTDGTRVTGLDFGDRVEPVAGPVVLAVPGWTAAELIPGLAVPDGNRAIVNVHFRPDRPPVLPGGLTMLGLLNAAAEWLFVRDGILTVTVSAADRLVDEPAEAIADLIWAEAGPLVGGGPRRHYRVIKEKRATFLATPANETRRPGPRTAYDNLVLAGDWTATGLPSCIEGAIQSGAVAARAASNDLHRTVAGSASAA